MTDETSPTMLMSGAEPFFYPGDSTNGKTGVLVLHGLSATPDEVRWLGQHLAAQGFTVHGPRLTGHGTDYRDLDRIHWRDWFAAAQDGYHLLRTGCERVVVAGLSMGGVLSLLLAATLPEHGFAVDGLVVMAAPLSLPDAPSAERLALIRHLRPHFPAADTSDFPRRLRTEQMRRGEPNRGRVRYDLWATQCVIELHGLMDAARPRLGAITAPACLIYSQADQTVAISNQDAVAAGLVNAARVKQHTLTQSGHILTQDDERETVFAWVADFVAGVHTGTGQG